MQGEGRNGVDSGISREELEMSVLKETSIAVGEALEINRVFEDTMDILARRLHMRRGTLVIHDECSDELRIAAAHGLSGAEMRKGRYKPGEGVTGQVVLTGKPVAVEDISKHSAFLDRTGARKAEKLRDTVSFVCVPIRSDKEVVGAISIDRSFTDNITLEKDLRLLQIIAALVGQAMKINRMVMMERRELLAENMRLKKDLHSRYRFGNIVAASSRMQDVIATAATVAKSNATVLLRGETGTGKELVAGLIHYNSNRSEGPFIKVNCSALSENLLESELFGHEKGSFTGATTQKQGRFELSDGGTIFLDEIGTVSGRLQVKLLRVLQEKEFERVGGVKTIKSDVRVVAATNADLEAEISEGRFREDLYYRLNVIPIFIPSLRERREDIPFLVDFFLEKYNRECGKEVSRLSREVLDMLLKFPWPGNVRELESCMERAVVLSHSGTITPALLPVSVRSYTRTDDAAPRPGLKGNEETDARQFIENITAKGSGKNVYEKVMSGVEKILIEQVLAKHAYTRTRAAEELGISRNTVRNKIKELGIEDKTSPKGAKG